MNYLTNKTRKLYVLHECNKQGIDLDDTGIDGICNLFSMHMAFDPEYSQRLQNAVEAFGWNIVQREMPDEYARLNDDEAANDLCVNTADDYATQLKVHLAHLWLACE